LAPWRAAERPQGNGAGVFFWGGGTMDKGGAGGGDRRT